VARNEVQKLKTQNSFIISEEAQKQAGLEVDLMDAQEKVEKLTREKGINKEYVDRALGMMNDEYFFGEGLNIRSATASDRFLLRHKGRSHLTFKMFLASANSEPLIDEYVSTRDEYGDYITYLHTPRMVNYTEIRDLLSKNPEAVDTFKLLNMRGKQLKDTGLYKLLVSGIVNKHPTLKMQSLRLLNSDKFSDFSNVLPLNWRMAEVDMAQIRATWGT